MTASKAEVRPYYGELIGYLTQAPSLDKVAYIRDPDLWEQYHGTLDKLGEAASEDFSRFKVTTESSDMGAFIRNSVYRSKLNGLIMHLHSKYFLDETPPFSGAPQTVVSQSQQQSMQAQIVMITEFQSLIDKRLFGAKEELDEKQKTFLEKVKAALPTIKSSVELVKTLIRIAAGLGLSMDQVKLALGL